MQSIKIYIIDKYDAVMKALKLRLQMVDPLKILYSGTYRPNLAAKVGAADVALVGLTSSRQAKFIETEKMVQELLEQNTAVILLTTYINEVERELALNAGAARYLLKTIDSDSLIAEITAVFQEKQNPSS